MESLVIKASNKEEAAQKALKQLSNHKDLTVNDLVVEEEKNVFSMLQSINKYKVSVQKHKKLNISLLKDVLELNKVLKIDLSKVVEFDLSDYVERIDAELHIKKSDDKMKAYVDYIPSQGCGTDYDAQKLIKKLKEENVVYGIKKESINEIINSSEVIEDLLIAEGKDPKPGTDGELIFHVDCKSKNVGTFREDGSMDFHDLDIVNNVKEGEKLVSKKEAVPGETGKNIAGAEIRPNEPKDPPLPKGKNTKINEDNVLVSTAVGHVSYNNDKVNVQKVYKVKGDVDFNTGNINFIGNVFIEGNVTEGFEVKAKGEIHVRGNVEAAHLKSDGDIIINKNFIGKNKGKIECDGDLKTKSIQNGIVFCKGDVYVKDAIMHSKIHAAGEISLTGHKGLIVGGEVRATKEINANIIGSSLATKTIVSAGLDPETRDKHHNAQEELAESKSNLEKTEKAIKILGQIKKQRGNLLKEKAQMLKRLINTRKDLLEKINTNQEIVKELSEKIANAVDGKIVAKRKIYPGVKIQIGNYYREVDETHTRTVFKIKERELCRFGL
ncbi:MAG: FapA family protein [Bacillota bacterium]